MNRCRVSEDLSRYMFKQDHESREQEEAEERAEQRLREGNYDSDSIREAMRNMDGGEMIQMEEAFLTKDAIGAFQILERALLKQLTEEELGEE